MPIFKRKAILGPNNCLHKKKEKVLVVMPTKIYDTGAFAAQIVCGCGKVSIF